MRLISFLDQGQPRLAALKDGHVYRLESILEDPQSNLMDILRQGPDALASLSDKLAQSDLQADQSLTLESMALLPPIERPGKIICLGLNYADHAAEGGHSRPEYPSVFLRCATSLVAHGQNMILPACSEQLDYEAELAVIIGTRCKNVPAEKAQEVIAGYSCFNDGSIRDYQRKTAQWTVGKNFDATGAFGPFFVTAQELPPAAKGLRIQTRLNGVVMQDANTSDMLFPVEEAIAILSECMTLEPGDVIVTGTPAGVGAARKPPVWMKANDLVEVEIEGIGILSNTIISQKQQGDR